MNLQDRYNRIAPLYDRLSALYSAGAMARSKRVHLRWLKMGQRVLYVGAGTAEECTYASALGTHVTICDSSSQMIARARRRLDKEHLLAEFQLGDARSLSGEFDVVVAPYFLNVFNRAEVGPAIAALANNLSSGGSLVVVDFRGPTGRWFFRLLQRLYYVLPQLLFLILTRNPWHELYDYPKLVLSAAPGLALREQLTTRVFGLPLLETIRFERVHV